MEIYSFYTTLFSMNLMRNGITGVSIKSMIGILAISLLALLIFFVLQGFGLWTMAKRKGLKKAFFAFLPFANLLLIDKLAGDCEIFGHKMKRGGVYAMIAQIALVITSFLLIFAEGILFTKYASSINYNSATGEIIWVNLDAFGVSIYSFYKVWGSFLNSLFGLAYELLLFVLMISLLKRYSAKNYMILSTLQLFVPVARYVIIFVVRNNKAIDYDEYRRAKYEEYARRNASYGNPYGRPYGNPYSNPYGTSRGQNTGSSSQGEQNPFEEFGSSKEDPFADINDYSSENSKTSSEQNSSNDDFC